MNDRIFEKARAKQTAGKHNEAIRLYQMILMKEPKHLDANYLLGTTYAEIGKWEEAKKYLLRAEKIMAESPYIKVNLGNVYKAQGDNETAFVYYLNALMLQHDLPEARHNLSIVAALLEEESPETAQVCFEYGLMCMWGGRAEEALAVMQIGNCLDPENAHLNYFIAIMEGNSPGLELQKAFAEQEFDKLAPYFDNKLNGELQYDAPRHIDALLKQVCGSALDFPSVVDLGCGTGMVGQVVRSYAGHLTGIDISEKMLEVAAAKQTYDQLIKGDVVEKLLSAERAFDLFVAADVLIYVGDMAALLDAVKKKANPGALFLFTTEKNVLGGVELQMSGRYAHGREYVQDAVATNGSELVEVVEIPLRKEADHWILGDLYCVKMK